MNIRNFLFSNRSFTPVPIALVIIYLSDPSILYFIYGMPLILVGELIRINAVSHAGGITRTMNVGAPSLCTRICFYFKGGSFSLFCFSIYDDHIS